MEEALKKRLVGAAVLASLAVIFVPMLIGEPKVEDPRIQEVSQPPHREAFENDLLNRNIQRPSPVLVDIDQQTQAIEKPQARAEIVAKPPKSVVKDASPAHAMTGWVVQVGSFSNAKNAANLVQRLRDAGMQSPDPAQVNVAGKTLYRVTVGPLIEKARAEKLLAKVNKVSGLKAQLRRYP